MKLHINQEDFINAIQLTAEELRMAPEFVEKDYWICQILQNLSRHELSGRIVWKGGTSLSKAYDLIKRFSSDVDFAVLLEGLSQNQQKKLVAKIGRDTTIDLEDLDVPGQTIKNNRFRKTFHGYRTEYLNVSFAQDLLDLIAHDKTEFDRPPLWKTSDIKTSPLFADFKNLWEKVSPIYISEVGNLSYGTIPTSEQIYTEISKLLGIAKKIIE